MGGIVTFKGAGGKSDISDSEKRRIAKRKAIRRERRRLALQKVEAGSPLF
jgi:hypothetical protein